MMIPALMGAPSPSPFGQVIGAVDPTQDPNTKLSVKAYSVSGQTVWGSYQCAPCNDAIVKLKKRLNAFAGVLHRNTLTVDGLIGDPTVAMAQAVATYALTHEIYLQGSLLKGFTSKQLLAERAHVASDLVRQIGELLGFDPDHVVVTNPPKPTTSTTPSSPTPSPTLPPSPIEPYPFPTASTSIFSTAKWPWYAAGGILLAGLVTATVIVWRPAKKRKK